MAIEFAVLFVKAVFVAAVFAAVCYLVPRALWRPVTEPGQNQDECPEGGSRLSKTGHSPSGVVRVIRLTDDGEFANRCELTDVLYEVRNPKRPELVVWYIHGWKHNGNEDDLDFRKFKSLIETLNNRQPEEKEGRHVVGIYVGWDGAVGPPLLQNLTFWNRKRAADRISQSAVLTKIMAMAKYAREQAGQENTSRDVTIMIGHSFGARILYAATSQVFLYEVERRHPGRQKAAYGVIEGPADLILLLNPAFEASMYTAMNSIRRRKWWESIDPAQRPLLLTIATENDCATTKAFPLGQQLQFATRDRQRQTLGNYKDFITHNLKSAVSPRDGLTTSSTFWFDNFETGELRLEKADSKQLGNPFLVARTTKEIIDGHNGIWGEDFRKWLISFFLEAEARAGARQSRSLAGHDAIVTRRF